jgi:hypothetical protein
MEDIRFPVRAGGWEWEATDVSLPSRVWYRVTSSPTNFVASLSM